MIGIFSAFMAVFAYMFGLANAWPETPNTSRYWIVCLILIILALSSIGYAAKLGREEDKKRNALLDEQLSKITQVQVIGLNRDKH